MNINNNCSVSFGMKVNKNLSSTLKNELVDNYKERLTSHTAKVRYQTLTKELDDKFQQISNWGEDSYELLETVDNVRNRRTIGLRNVNNPNRLYKFNSLGKNLLKCLLTLKKDVVFEGIIKLEDSAKAVKSNLK